LEKIRNDNRIEVETTDILLSKVEPLFTSAGSIFGREDTISIYRRVSW
jgi:hypothetical protein